MPVRTKVIAATGGLLNAAWKYVPSHCTNIRVTFERARQGLLNAPIPGVAVKGSAL